jgi:hypothetical protein
VSPDSAPDIFWPDGSLCGECIRTRLGATCSQTLLLVPSAGRAVRGLSTNIPSADDIKAHRP